MANYNYLVMGFIFTQSFCFTGGPNKRREGRTRRNNNDEEEDEDDDDEPVTHQLPVKSVRKMR